MKKIIIQFSLVGIGVVLFFFTYYYSVDKERNIGIDENTLTKYSNKLTDDMSNVIEHASYNGTDNRGTFFKLNANLAEVFNDKPNLSNMKIVDAIISLKDGRKIYIKSDACVYDRVTNDARFTGNVVVTESNNKIISDNLDMFIATKNLITVYNNVKYNGEKGVLVADKIEIDILKNESNIFMFDKKNRVQALYKN